MPDGLLDASTTGGIPLTDTASTAENTSTIAAAQKSEDARDNGSASSVGIDSSKSVASSDSELDYYEKWKHHKVKKYIRICKEFIVHIDVDGKLDWETDTEDPEPSDEIEKQEQALNSVYCDIVVNEAASLAGYSEDHKERYLTILGEAYVHWIKRDAPTAKRLVSAAKLYYRERSAETSRRWYLQTTIRVASLMFLAGILAWIGKDSVISFIGDKVFHFCLAATAGSVGALFSVIARSGKLQFKASAGKDLHELEAASRVCTGAISGVIVYLALSSELILGALIKNVHRAEVSLLAAIAGGAAERLATSIISKFDDTKTEEHSRAQSEEESKQNEA